MTIDELRARKQELLARKKYELELRESSQGDNFSLFMVNEELLDVNAKLRALSPSHGVGKRGRVTNSEFAPDKQQFIDWTREDSNQELDEARSMMRDILRVGIASITGRQREILLLWSDGLNQTAIAERLGVDKSTVNRTLKRAQYNAKQITEARMIVEKFRDQNRLDVSDPEVGKLIISTLTPHQAVCFYLYYSERLTVREVGQILQIDHSTIVRTIQRALARISDVLGDSIHILENVEYLDDLVFLIYCNIRDRYDDLPPEVQEHIKRSPSVEYTRHDIAPYRGDEHGSIRRPRLQVMTNWKEAHGKLRHEQHGRLLQNLLERYQGVRMIGRPQRNRWRHPIARWLLSIFQVISKPKKPL